MKKYIWIALTAMLAAACENEKTEPKGPIASLSHSYEHANSYIVEYDNFEGLLLQFGKELLPTFEKGDLFSIDFTPQTAYAAIYSDNEDKKQLFNEISNKNNDTTYDYESHRDIHQRTFIFFTEDTDYACFAENFVSVDFITEQAWDDTHPAGSSINDLVMCREVRTKYRYILSGYSDESLLEPIDDKLVKDMTPDDWRCLSAAYLLEPKFSFASMPTNPDCYYYTIKLRVRTDADRIIECSSRFTYYTN